MGFLEMVIGFFVSVTKTIAMTVNNFGKPLADIMHGFLPVIPGDALVGTGTLILLAGIIGYKLVTSNVLRLAIIFILGSVFFLVVSGSQLPSTISSLNQTVTK